MAGVGRKSAVAAVALTPALALGLMLAFPVTWVGLMRCSGAQLPLSVEQGRPLLVEAVGAGGEERRLYDVLRVQLLDPKTGAAAAGPWLYQGSHWRGASNGLGWFARPTLTAVSLTDGRVAADPARLAAAGPPGPWPRREALRPSVERLRWKGAGRMALEGSSSGATFLQPDFVYDVLADAPVSRGGAFVVAHYDRHEPSGRRRGLLLSLIDADALERWRWRSRRDDADGAERLTFAAVLGDVLVVQTDQGSRAVAGIELGTGKQLWKRGD